MNFELAIASHSLAAVTGATILYFCLLLEEGRLIRAKEKRLRKSNENSDSASNDCDCT